MRNNRRRIVERLGKTNVSPGSGKNDCRNSKASLESNLAVRERRVMRAQPSARVYLRCVLRFRLCKLHDPRAQGLSMESQLGCVYIDAACER